MKTSTTTRRTAKTANRTRPVTDNTVIVTPTFEGMALTPMNIVNGYLAGDSIARLAGVFGFGQDAVRALIVANNVAIRPRGRYKATAKTH